MSSETRESFLRLLATWRSLDADDKTIMVIGYLGLLLMAVAVVAAFGWPGVVFVIGRIFWNVLEAKVRSEKD